MKQLKALIIFLLIFCSSVNAQKFEFTPGKYLYPVLEKGKYGYINSTGQWVINPKFEWCDFFYEGLAIAREKGKYGFITVKGEWISKPVYDSAKYFSEGLAAVALKNSEGNLNWDFIDTTGRMLNIKVPALSNITTFNSGRSVGVEEGILSFYFFNNKGNIAFESKDFYLDENNVSSFSEGLLHVYVGERNSTFIDTAGNLWGKGEFENCGDFHNGLAWFQSGTHYGYINTMGEIVVPAQYDSTGNFSEGIALVKSNMKYDQASMKLIGGSVAYIDIAGKKITSSIYSEGTAFSDGFALVNYNGLYGIIDKDGKVVIDYQFEEGKIFFRGIAYVKKENHWEYINTNGKKIF